MRDVFGTKGLVFWWGFFTTFIFLDGLARQLAESVKNASVVQDNTLYNALTVVDHTIAQAVETFAPLGTFKPDATFFGGLITIQNRDVVAAVGLAVLGLVAWRFRKAIQSKAFADDFAMLGIFYLVLQFELELAKRMGWAGLAKALQDRQVLGPFIIGVIVFLTARSKASEDSKIFWRGVLEIVVVGLFFWSQATTLAFAGVLELCAKVGEFLRTPTVTVAWAAVGAGLCIWHLYTVGERKRRPTAEVLGKLKEDINKSIDKAMKESE